MPDRGRPPSGPSQRPQIDSETYQRVLEVGGDDGDRFPSALDGLLDQAEAGAGDWDVTSPGGDQ